MDLKENTVYYNKLSMSSFTDALMKIYSKPPNKSFQSLTGNIDWNLAWDIVYNNHHINVYGIKLLNNRLGIYTYEGVLFDKFPENYKTLYICYLDDRGIPQYEEIKLVELTDTKIVFQVTCRVPKNLDNIVIEWD